MTSILPISAIVPSLDRSEALARMLSSLAEQGAQPLELVVVDGSQNGTTEQRCREVPPGLQTRLTYCRAKQVGAAAQRQEAVFHASQDFILFLDDDIRLEPDCLLELWRSMEADQQLGGVNATIINQQYAQPGRLSEVFFRLLHGRSEASYAGKCIGPAMNLLPQDRADLPETVPVEWLNTTCTLYRREALPNPLFPAHFTGYSLMEDLALSLVVSRKWKLANARTARIFHDSQPGAYKSNQTALARMELVNRHYVMTKVLGRTQKFDYAKLALLEAFGVVTPLRSPSAWRVLPSVLLGKASAIRAIIRSERRRTGASLIECEDKNDNSPGSTVEQ